MSSRPMRLGLTLLAAAVTTGLCGAAIGNPSLIDVNPDGASDPEQFLVHDSRLFFVAAGEGVGRELWMTDGTTEGTVLLHDIAEGAADSEIRDLTSFGEALVFVANDGMHGQELWIWDADGVRLVKDIREGAESSEIGFTEYGRLVTPPIICIGEEVFFVANDGLHGFELWKSDGTEGGTQLVWDSYEGTSSRIIGHLTEFQNELYFVHDETWLYHVDKDSGQVSRILEAYLPQDGMDGLAVVDDKLFAALRFGRRTGALGLWHADRLWFVTPLDDPAYQGEKVESMTSFGGKLYFRLMLYVEDGGELWENDTHELWSSDATTSGTIRILGGDTPIIHGIYGGYLLVNNGGRLIRINAAGEQLDHVPHRLSPYLADIKGMLFYRDAMELGTYKNYELWKMDMDEFNPVFVKDINPGDESSSPDIYAGMGNKVFLTANDGTHGIELWESDGSEPGTRLVMDINPGPTDANIQHVTLFNGMIAFAANDGVHGQELWMFRPEFSTAVHSDHWLIYANGFEFH